MMLLIICGILIHSEIAFASEELLQKEGVTTGGEGCQWQIGMDISKLSPPYKK